MAELAGWAALPSELLLSVAERLPAVADLCHLRAVCTSWSSALKGLRPLHPFPWLGMTKPYMPGGATFLSLSAEEKRFYSLSCFSSRSVPLPWTRLVGQCGGWLVLEGDLIFFLFNPLTGHQIRLPSLYTVPHFDAGDVSQVWKVVLSAGPPAGPRDGALVAYRSTRATFPYGADRLAFLRAGEKKWNPLPFDGYVHDITYHDGKFFILFHNGRLYASDFSARSHENLDLVADPIDRRSRKRMFLVPSPDRLLLIQGYRVWEYVPKGRPSCWFEVEHLGDRSLFVDDRHSMSLTAGHFPGIKRNYIYLATKYPEGPQGPEQSKGDELGLSSCVRAFNLEKRKIEPCFPFNVRVDHRDRRFLAFWFVLPLVII